MENQKPPYNEVRQRIKLFESLISEGHFSLVNPFNLEDNQFENLKELIIENSRQLTEQYPSSSLNPDLDGLLKHLNKMEGFFSWLFQFDKFKQLLPEKERENFNFIRFLVLIHDLERFIFNGPFPINYIDQVGDALNERRFFPNFPFLEFLHSIDYITERKKPPSPDENPLIYIFKAVDSLAKPGRDPNKFFGEEYDQWLQRQVNMGRFPIKIRRYDGVFADISAEQYRFNDLNFIDIGLKKLIELTGLNRDDIFAKIKEINFS
ncbi:MAG: hypothetical protein Fur009_6780 [Candidatus Microgenomates bacterium]